MKSRYKFSLAILLSLFFVAFLLTFLNKGVYAQSCECTASQQRYTCEPDFGGEYCLGYTVNQTFNGSIAPSDPSTCEYTYSYMTCSSPGGNCSTKWNYVGPRACTVSAPPAPPPPAPPPPPGPGPAPPPPVPAGCGLCTAFNCTTGASYQDSNGNCVCDPRRCDTGGGGNTCPANADKWVRFDGATITPNPLRLGETGQITIRASAGESHNCGVRLTGMYTNNLNWANGRTHKFIFNNCTTSRGSISFQRDRTMMVVSNWSGKTKTVRCTVTPFATGTDLMDAWISGRDGDYNNLTDRYGNKYLVTIVGPRPWFQVVAGNVTANGSVVTSIPPTCQSPGCEPYLILDDQDSGVPGMVILANNPLSVKSSPNSVAQVNSENWSARTGFSQNYSYEYFESISSGKTFSTIPGTINAGNINSVRSAPIDPATGFSWLKSSGDVYINTPLTIPNRRKTVIFINGDLIISNEIKINSTENSVAVFIVKGNIFVANSVGNNRYDDRSPNITGLFWADGQFATGTSGNKDDDVLVIYGSVAARQGLILQRNLGESPGENDSFPGEVFIYAPEFQLNFPETLSEKKLFWREVAP